METCIVKTLLKFQPIQILDENTFITLSSVHSLSIILPIEVRFTKAITNNLMLSDNQIITRNGELIYTTTQTIIDAKVIKNHIIIQLPIKLIDYDVDTQEETIIFQGQIDNFIIEYPKIAIQSNFYYLFDYSNKGLLKIGTTEKKAKFGCVFYEQYILCGRPNGILWKCQIDNGEVISSYKFKNIKFAQMGILSNHIINLSQTTLTIISINEMEIQSQIEIEYQCMLISNNVVLYYNNSYLYSLELLAVESAFHKHIQQQNQTAEQLFLNNISLQNYNNAILLAKNIKCVAACQLITQLTKRNPQLQILDNIVINIVAKTHYQIPKGKSISTIQCPTQLKLKAATEKMNDVIGMIKKVQTKLTSERTFKQMKIVLKKSVSDILKLSSDEFHILIISNIQSLSDDAKKVVFQIGEIKIKFCVRREFQLGCDLQLELEKSKKLSIHRIIQKIQCIVR